MKKILPLLLCLLLPPAGAAGGENAARLPAAVRSTLDEKFPGWRFAQVGEDVRRFLSGRNPGALPYVVRGDFDGDRRADYALLIEHRNFARGGAAFTHVAEKLVFLSRGAGYRLHRLEPAAPANPEVYLTLARKGQEGTDFRTGRKFRYPHDSVGAWHFEKAGGTYLYHKSRFRYVVESD